MTTTRPALMNPMDNLTQTAYALAFYLRCTNPVEIIKCLNDVKVGYTAIYDSYLGPIYKIFKLRNRVSDIDKAINAYEVIIASNKSHTRVHEYEAQKPYRTLTEIGGWEDTSVNTNFLRKLVKKLADYDATIDLTKDEIHQLHLLLLKVFDERLILESSFLQQEENLRHLNEVKIKKANELKDIVQTRYEIVDIEMKIDELKKREMSTSSLLRQLDTKLKEYEDKIPLIKKTKEEKEVELKKIEDETLKQSQMIEATKSILSSYEITEKSQPGNIKM